MVDTTLPGAPTAKQQPDGPEPPSRPPALRPVELARWAWRQLTSMRTALVLLFLLTLAAVPGSLVPQRSVDPARVAEFAADHPDLTPWYERLSLFSVYSSPWFAATYLLLFVSLVGCVLPRSRAHLAAALARPPAAPRNLGRLPVHESWTTEAAPAAVLAAAQRELRTQRFRVDAGADSVAAEKGHLKETGNLLFHLSLLLILVAVALGHLFGYSGSVVLVEGRSFSNTVSAYDIFTPGPATGANTLAPFTVTLDDLAVRYQADGDQRGAPREFRAAVTYTSTPETAPQREVVRVNHPLRVGGAKVFLLGNGYAPVFTVRDTDGTVVFSGPVPFLPRDGNLHSTGVVKVPGSTPQLGFEGLFLPTAVLDPTSGPVSVFPGLRRPRAVLNAWTGDLGLDDGVPQSVYSLDSSGMTQVRNPAGELVVASLAPGATMRLPDGQQITFGGVRRYATLQISHNPGLTPAFGAAVLLLTGLMGSLFVRRRRVWVRAAAGPDGRTLVEVAGLARSEGESRDVLSEEVRGLADVIRREES